MLDRRAHKGLNNAIFLGLECVVIAHHAGNQPCRDRLIFSWVAKLVTRGQYDKRS